MKSKRELLFFIENYTGNNVDIKEMSHPKKHARTYMNRFIINEDDQYEISKIEEIDSDWEFKSGPRPDDIIDRIQELVRRISAESLDIFLFGWYEFNGRTEHQKSEHQRYKRRIDICNTLKKERFGYNVNGNNFRADHDSAETL